MATRLYARSLRRHNLPGYPTKLAVLADGRILRKHQPASWRRHRDLVGAAGVILSASSAGCADGRGGSGAGAPAQVAPIVKAETKFVVLSAGATPAFLSEEDGLRIIRDELAKAGMQAPKLDVELPEIRVSGVVYAPRAEWLTDERKMELTPVEGPLEADVVYADHRVVVEFISRDDAGRLGGDDGYRRGWNLYYTATHVSEQVRRQGQGMYFGALYDPATIYYAGTVYPLSDERRKKTEQDRLTAQRESETKLREQVRQFVDWLKGQGVI